MDPGEILVKVKARDLANTEVIAAATWKPSNEWNGEFATFNEDGEAQILFHAPVEPAIEVGIRIFANQDQWEAVWLVVPEATL